jgi:hypothetical protein
MTDERIKYLEKAILVYQKCCAVRHSVVSLIAFVINHPFNEGGTGGVRKELRLLKATRLPARYSRHQTKGNSRQLFYSDWRRNPAGSISSIQTDEYEKCGAPGERLNSQSVGGFFYYS